MYGVYCYLLELNRESLVPIEKFSQNPNLLLVQTPKGSHIDYFTTYKCYRVIFYSFGFI